MQGLRPRNRRRLRSLAGGNGDQVLTGVAPADSMWQCAVSVALLHGRPFPLRCLLGSRHVVIISPHRSGTGAELQMSCTAIPFGKSDYDDYQQASDKGNGHCHFE